VNQDHSGDGLLELFASDVAAHTAAMRESLEGLAAEGISPERVETLLRGAHFIKGAARVVDAKPVIHLAGALEDCFQAAHGESLVLDKAHAPLLLRGVEVLAALAGVSGRKTPAQEEVDTLVEDLAALPHPERAGKAASGGKVREETPPMDQEEKEPDEEEDRIPALFREEASSLLGDLEKGLGALPGGFTAETRLEPLMRASHTLVSGCRIVKREEAARLARALETCFAGAQKGLLTLGEADLPVFNRAVGALYGLCLDDQGAATSPSEVNALVEELAAAGSGGPPSGGKPAAEPPPPDPEKTPGKPEPFREARPPQKPPAAKPKAPRKPATPSRVDPSILEIFQIEAVSLVNTCNESLLALEKNPTDADSLEALMRSAHSLKGGARIVELPLAVELAHAMEDCFVAAQKARVRLSSQAVDVLLEGVDVLAALAQGAGAAPEPGMEDRVEDLRRDILAITLGEEPPADIRRGTVAAVGSEEEKIPAVRKREASDLATRPENECGMAMPERPRAETAEKDRAVRVTAEKIEHLMGLAGEVVVSSRWLPPFSKSLLKLKRDHLELTTILDSLRERLENTGGDPEIRELVATAREKTRKCNQALMDRLGKLDVYTSVSANLSDRLYHGVIAVRMRPFADGVTGFPRMVRDLARDLGKKVLLDIVGKTTEVDRDILEKLDAPLTHLVRNAVDHGIEPLQERAAKGKPETGTVRIFATHRSGMLMITVSDDGRGVDPEQLRKKIVKKGMATQEMAGRLSEPELMDFLFLPGFSTAEKVTEISGRGVGLDVVHNMVHEVGGVVRASTIPGQGLTFHMELPLTLSVVRTFLVEIAGEPYAFPLARIGRCLILSPGDLKVVEDRQYIRFDNDNIALVNIHDVLEIREVPTRGESLPVVVVSDRFNAYGLVVDRFIGETDLVVRPLDRRMGRVPNVNAAAVMVDGSPVLVFDVEDLARSIDNLLSGKRLRKVGCLEIASRKRDKKRILVVDDSITVREMERKVLENSGYEVDVAVDGVDALSAVQSSRYDLVVSDVDMPRMNGIEFIRLLKADVRTRELPVVVVSYKDREEDRLKGLEAGADYYLTKSSFADDSFVQAVADLIGEP